MLKFKIKEVLLALDKRNSQTWLIKVCGFTRAKAYNIVHNKQKMISLKDFSEMCYQLNCTPNDLMYWLPTSSRPLESTHPCMAKLTPPDAVPEWKNIFKQLSPTEMGELKALAEQKIEDKKNRLKNIL